MKCGTKEANRITRRMADLCAQISTKGAHDYDPLGGTSEACYAAALIEWCDGAPRLTARGCTVAAEEIARKAADKARKNKAARGRSEALRSVGMVRTRYGWE